MKKKTNTIIIPSLGFKIKETTLIVYLYQGYIFSCVFRNIQLQLPKIIIPLNSKQRTILERKSLTYLSNLEWDPDLGSSLHFKSPWLTSVISPQFADRYFTARHFATPCRLAWCYFLQECVYTHPLECIILVLYICRTFIIMLS